MKYSILFHVVLWTISLPSFAQSFNKDTLFIKDALAHAQHIYHKNTHSHAPVYQGAEYGLYRSLDGEHPYFLSDDWIEGTIMYDDALYTQIPIQYDIEKDEIIIEYLNGNNLNPSKTNIQYFIINNHKFISLHNNGLENGFYEILYDGKVKAYARYKKILYETITRKVEHHFDEKTRYYIYKDGVYTAVKNKRSVLNTFKDKKRELKKFISKNKLSITQNKAGFIIQLSEQYDNL